MSEKGRLKAEILRAIHLSDSPATIGWLQGATNRPLPSIKDCISRLVVEHAVERRKIVNDDMNPVEYRLFPRGKSPKFYYMLKDRGLRKLRYYADIGLIEL
jgi:hypothetical protein